jgi:hypothetical protein
MLGGMAVAVSVAGGGEGVSVKGRVRVTSGVAVAVELMKVGALVTAATSFPAGWQAETNNDIRLMPAIKVKIREQFRLLIGFILCLFIVVVMVGVDQCI